MSHVDIYLNAIYILSSSNGRPLLFGRRTIQDGQRHLILHSEDKKRIIRLEETYEDTSSYCDLAKICRFQWNSSARRCCVFYKISFEIFDLKFCIYLGLFLDQPVCTRHYNDVAILSYSVIYMNKLLTVYLRTNTASLTCYTS